MPAFIYAICYCPPMPSVNFFLATTHHPIDEDHPLWHHPLPENRSPQVNELESLDAKTTTYGQYFSAVAQFCADNGWSRLIKAASSKMERPVVEKEIAGVSVFLEKHGAFYHPARLQVVVEEQPLSLVVNVAASSHGQRALRHELKALAHLNEHRPFGWLPNVYASVCDDLPMFLGDWFDGFFEFHLTRRPEGEEPALVVWDGAAEPCLLSDNQTAALYKKMAMILTACYDPVSSCQIFPWHHAAGDFVVRVHDDGVTVKLITVRDYVPITGATAEPEDESALLETLVVFFLHLSFRMRLDRIDGVADIVWAPDRCLAPMVEGFFQGLDLTALINGLPEAFPKLFRTYFNQYGAADLAATARRIAHTVFFRQADEHAVIDVNLDTHIQKLSHILAA